MQASFSEPVTLGTKIVYIPLGEHHITPTVDGKPGAIVSKVSAERGQTIVDNLNKSLTKRHSKNVRAIIDFDHASVGAAAAIPKDFEWDEKEGVILNLEWTSAGSAAIEGKNYSYFSPTFNMDRNTGEPVGVASGGAIGALVNDPAFTEIKRIAANKSQPNQTNTPEMDTNVLVKASLLTEAEAKTDQVEAIVSANLATIQAKADKVDGLEAEVVELKAAAVKGAEITADRAIEAAVNTGRIAAKDETNKSSWRESLVEAYGDDNKFAKVSAMLDAIKPIEDLLKREVVVAAGVVKPQDKQARQNTLLVAAKQALGSSSSFPEQWEHAQAEDPTAFED